MKKILLALLLLMPLSLFGTYGVQFFVVDGDAEKTYNEFINNDIEKIGFILSDPHERINDGYTEKYGKNNLDNLGFFSISNDVVMRSLLLKEPDLGGFSPFNLHIYKKKDEDKTYIGYIKPRTMLSIVGVDNKEVVGLFGKMLDPLENAIKSKFKPRKEFVKYEDLPENPMMKFSLKFDRGEELDDFIDSFQEKFEEVFEDKKYIIAGYKNYREAYDDLELPFEKYDAYFVYSLCHFKLSYSIFKDRPDAGVFAPCSMYMYIEKDTNVLHVGMPRLENWIAVMGIKDPVKQKDILALDKEVISLMKLLGASEILPPKVNWETSYSSAMKRAKKENKPVLVFMNKEGCGACKFMKTKTFKDEDMVDYINKNYVALSLDIYKNDAPKSLQVKVTPVFHFLKSDGTQAIETLIGGKNAAKFMPFLEKALKGK